MNVLHTKLFPLAVHQVALCSRFKGVRKILERRTHLVELRNSEEEIKIQQCKIRAKESRRDDLLSGMSLDKLRDSVEETLVKVDVGTLQTAIA